LIRSLRDIDIALRDDATLLERLLLSQVTGRVVLLSLQTRRDWLALRDTPPDCFAPSIAPLARAPVHH
jgi:hypothetical protein